MFEITIRETYILVKFNRAVNYESLMSAVRSVVGCENYKEMNDIFVFEDLPVYLSHQQLADLVHEVARVYPRDAPHRKTALVITSGFGKVVAQTWIEMARRLPPDYEIFSKIKDAESWVLSD